MRTRIVVIEDSPASRDFIVRLLRTEGHEVVAACDGETGVLAVARERPDVVLCDIQLPGIDGFEVLRALRGDPATREIPVCAVTAFALGDMHELARSAGFAGFLAKPVSAATLLPALRAVMARRNAS